MNQDKLIDFSTTDAVARRNRDFPIFEWILLLPYFGVRALYRKYSGYVPAGQVIS